ncbi:MAG: hypothetical protein ACJA0N_002834 [Pseudohongiellaceae bacterium]|jgi:hypothetical protein
MKTVKKTSEYTVKQRNDKRYAVVGANKKSINGEEKVKILLAEGLVTLSKAAPAPAEEAPAEEAAAE